MLAHIWVGACPEQELLAAFLTKLGDRHLLQVRFELSLGLLLYQFDQFLLLLLELMHRAGEDLLVVGLREMMETAVHREVN